MVVLTDLIQRTQYAREVLSASIRKSVLWASGIIISDSELSRLMKAGVGSTFEFDYFLDLVDNEGRISDDSNTDAGTDGISTGTDKAVGNYRNRSWGAKNITANLSTTGDPLLAIAGRVGAYWARQMDFTTISLCNGIIAGNALNDASDMINNQTAVAIGVNMIIDTQQTAGDHQDMFNVMICHSAVKSKLKKDGVTDKVYDDQGNFLFEALGGLRLVVTDNVPTAAAIPGAKAQVDTVTPDVVNDGVYEITIAGTLYSYTADADATLAEITAGITSAINAGAGAETAADTGTTVTITADVIGVSFTTALSGTGTGAVETTTPSAAADYLSYIAGGPFIGYGEGAPKRANEVAYLSTTGNGAGAETLWSRKDFCLHPYGFSFTNSSVASTSPTNAEFELAANWIRNADRKKIPFAALIHSI